MKYMRADACKVTLTLLFVAGGLLVGRSQLPTAFNVGIYFDDLTDASTLDVQINGASVGNLGLLSFGAQWGASGESASFFGNYIPGISGASGAYVLTEGAGGSTSDYLQVQLGTDGLRLDFYSDSETPLALPSGIPILGTFAETGDWQKLATFTADPITIVSSTNPPIPVTLDVYFRSDVERTTVPDSGTTFVLTLIGLAGLCVAGFAQRLRPASGRV